MDFEWDVAKSDLCQISRNFDFAYVISIFIDPDLPIEKISAGITGGWDICGDLHKEVDGY